jgi:hypothetical protein
VGENTVEIVADAKAARALGANGIRTTSRQLHAEARGFIKAQQLLGLDVSELKRIIISAKKPAKSQNLFCPDAGLWKRLKPGTGGPKRFMDLGMCGESEACQCCYCVPIRV